MTCGRKSDGKTNHNSDASTLLDKDLARPFVKWPGGKRSLVGEIAKSFPKKFKLYWEPFVGGGAVFFSLADRAERAILSDSNSELMLAYGVIRNELESLIKTLRFHEHRHRDNAEYYYEVRNQKPRLLARKAARFIYLNKTCFNGLYRVNRSGKFNVPKGEYSNPTICDETNLRAVSQRLQNTILFPSSSFEKTVQPSLGDLVYCDPPYHNTFTKYQAGGFDERDQKNLRDAALSWSRLGAKVILSNNDTELIRELYSDQEEFCIREVHATRAINRDGKGRGVVPELIIETNSQD